MINPTNIACFFILLGCIQDIVASNGDTTTHFHNCRDNCETANCTKSTQEIAVNGVDYLGQTIFEKMLSWSCKDECQYLCMWKTVDAFTYRGWEVPQFYGKWPFVRIMGLQEPASVVFSIFNLATHMHLLQKFRKKVRVDSPCYLLWHIFALICINGWVWSTVFHARDFPITELLDYTSAYSIVLVSFYCMLIRMIHDKSIILRGIISALAFSFYINYFAYLSAGRFSYSFNMKTNIITGILSGVGWLTWSFLVRKRRPYYKKMVLFYILLALSMGLELLDFPPIFWIFDAHAIWHLSSVPLAFLLYNFVIEDCQTLRKEKNLAGVKFNKEI